MPAFLIAFNSFVFIRNQLASLHIVVVLLPIFLTLVKHNCTAEDNGQLQARRQAVTALIGLQAEDGGWHSETYGLLKPGTALTAFVLHALAQLPDNERKSLRLNTDKGFAFLSLRQAPNGGLGMTEDWLEYPSYSSALTLMALLRLKPANWENSVKSLQAYLLSVQHRVENGCAVGEAAFGGWSPDGQSELNLPRRADISASRYVLQALQLAEVPEQDPVWRRAYLFVMQRQFMTPAEHTELSTHNGGFHYEATIPRGNKAGTLAHSEEIFLPYGSATADGLICLKILRDKLPEQKAELDERIAAASTWLIHNRDALYTPGFLPDSEAVQVGWHKSLAFYYRSALFESPELFLEQPAWKAQLKDVVLRQQSSDGLWRNRSTLMKENDPLIATVLSLRLLLP